MGLETTRSNLDHPLHAVAANDIDRLGRPHAVAAAGALQLAGAARIGCDRRHTSRRASAPDASRRVPVLSVHVNLAPSLPQDVFDQRVGRLGDAPPDTRVIANVQIALLGSVAEPLVVVCPASAAILNPVLQVVEVHHFMQHRRHYVFNGSIKRSRSDVQLMALLAVRPAPRFGDGHMTVCTGC